MVPFRPISRVAVLNHSETSDSLGKLFKSTNVQAADSDLGVGISRAEECECVCFKSFQRLDYFSLTQIIFISLLSVSNSPMLLSESLHFESDHVLYVVTILQCFLVIH